VSVDTSVYVVAQQQYSLLAYERREVERLDVKPVCVSPLTMSLVDVYFFYY